MKNSGIEDKTKIPKMLLIGLVVLQFLVLFGTLFRLKADTTAGSGKSSSVFVPVWAAVFIPILAHQKNKGKHSEKYVQFLWLLVGIALLVLVSSVIFYLKAVRVI